MWEVFVRRRPRRGHARRLVGGLARTRRPADLARDVTRVTSFDQPLFTWTGNGVKVAAAAALVRHGAGALTAPSTGRAALKRGRGGGGGGVGGLVCAPSVRRYLPTTLGLSGHSYVGWLALCLLTGGRSAVGSE